MGKKISQLNANELPYDGHELVAIVEAGETRGGTLSSFMNYLTGGVYDSLGGTPGVQPIASPLKNNFFITTQTIAGDLSGTGRLTIGTSQSASGTLATIAGGTLHQVDVLL